MPFKRMCKGKIPLVLRRKENTIYCQCQYEVTEDGEHLLGYYLEYYKIEPEAALEEIGVAVRMLLKRFHEYSDLYPEDIVRLRNMTLEEYKKVRSKELHEFMQVDESTELMREFTECSIHYTLSTNTYDFGISWFNKTLSRPELYHSTGGADRLRFDTPLEFDDTIPAEELGRMVIEAFERSRQLAEGKLYATKEILLPNGTRLELRMPWDKHFIDMKNKGNEEAYQIYEYFPREDGQVKFILGPALELQKNLCEENIYAVWENAFDAAEIWNRKEVTYGIYTVRAEFKNKKMHKISYFMLDANDSVLECTMELLQPNRRKKKDEKISGLFEQFALRCWKLN